MPLPPTYQVATDYMLIESVNFFKDLLGVLAVVSMVYLFRKKIQRILGDGINSLPDVICDFICIMISWAVLLGLNMWKATIYTGYIFKFFTAIMLLSALISLVEILINSGYYALHISERKKQFKKMIKTRREGRRNI